MFHQFNHAAVEAQVFRGTATWDQQGVEIFAFDVSKTGVKNKVVARFFAVGLVAFEVVNRGADAVAGGFVRAYRSNAVTGHLQCLKGHHQFVIFHVITGDNQYVSHGGLLSFYDGWPASLGDG